MYYIVIIYLCLFFIYSIYFLFVAQLQFYKRVPDFFLVISELLLLSQ